MERYAVKITGVGGTVRYESIGTGQDADPQKAHLYTTLALAEAKAKHYRSRPQWYQTVEIITVKVVWPE